MQAQAWSASGATAQPVDRVHTLFEAMPAQVAGHSSAQSQYLLICEGTEVIAFPAELRLDKPLREHEACKIAT